jgi:hypothetical protein
MKKKEKEGTCCYRFELHSGRSVLDDFQQQITQNFVFLLLLLFCTIGTLNLKA